MSKSTAGIRLFGTEAIGGRCQTVQSKRRIIMQYLCLIYSADNAAPKSGTPEFGALMQGYMAFTEEMKTTGKLVSADQLQPVATATTVTTENGKVEVTDGPFAETTETLGGYYLLDCSSLDDAIEQSAKIPTAAHGRIEIRPVVVWDN